MVNKQQAGGAEFEPEFVVRCSAGHARLSLFAPQRAAQRPQVGAVDVISSLVEGLGTSMESLAAQVQLRDLVFLSCADDAPDVRQSGFALMGDLAKACPSHLLPTLQRCFEAACATLQHDALVQEYAQAGTNACWAIGELALQATPEDMAPFALPLLQCVATVLTMRLAVGKGMLENAAIALGRLALRCPQPLAQHLASFVAPWCIALRRLRDGTEKAQAFAGLCALVTLNPMVGWQAFVPLANAFATWRTISNETLRRQMAEILRGYQARCRACCVRLRARCLTPSHRTRNDRPTCQTSGPRAGRGWRRRCSRSFNCGFWREKDAAFCAFHFPFACFLFAGARPAPTAAGRPRDRASSGAAPMASMVTVTPG